MNKIFHNAWPKILSLVLAIATWFYVFDLVNSDSLRKETVADILSRTNFIVKEVEVKPVFTGITPAGYKVDFDNLKIRPASVAIFGPEVIVDKVTELKTDRIELGEYTRPVTLRLGIHSNVESLQLDDKVVEISLPVYPIKKAKTEQVPRKAEDQAVESK
ncbi:MAG: YbbR-like domain-containing protein [Candidatus Omnitrophica bacterium]|nr:YbbR-like domain-containing protein [Candidatus Omnitrophota bacterium]MBU1128515.1 YbbR-like domain-containing protein [Candidatus Omnitrophota bacterium]MBU1784457.1 YbbR-like domain-containing protein [Candidatus Omnitrophota bacterium]MBU1851356.1 YbbR-like domain-containing protein [Candidatus Omnitrophota bacterium]